MTSFFTHLLFFTACSALMACPASAPHGGELQQDAGGAAGTEQHPHPTGTAGAAGTPHAGSAGALDDGVDAGTALPPAAAGHTASGAQGGALSAAPVAGSGGSAACSPACATPQRCELVQVQCIRAPCPPIAMCVGGSAGAAAPPPGVMSCDPRNVLCKRATPKCAEGSVPSVVGSCYGDCIPIEQCACDTADACPQRDSYTCLMSAKHCTPYL